MFSAQNEAAVKAAAEVEILASQDDSVQRDQPLPPSEPEKKVILPPGIRADFLVDELPDDSTRKVVPDKRTEDMNKSGSFEQLMKLAGGMKSRG